MTDERTEVEAETSMEEPKEKTAEKSEGAGSVDYSNTFRTLSQGDLVDGVVVHIDKEGVLVDVGTKSEGIIRPHELSTGPVQDVESVVSVGDTIEVYVMQPEGEDGNLMLSKKRADFEKAWDKVQHTFEGGKVLNAMVTDRVKGGLVVDLGIRGFVPGSHVGSGNVKNLDKYVGQSLPLKVIEVDRDRRKVVLSHRLAVEEERSKQREETVGTLKEGEVRDGVVRRITDYGAFIDLGGIDGLLHVSEMSWTRVNHPSDVVKVGEKLQVMILRLNLDAGRISLGLRQIMPDPWAEMTSKWKVGDIVKGNVSRLVPFGAFVQIQDGVEAIIPNSELATRRVKRPEDVVSVGDSVEAKVIDMRPEERRMTLSIRQIHEAAERRDYESYQSARPDSTRMTLGDLIGDQLQGISFGSEQPEEEEQPVGLAEEPSGEMEPAETPEVEEIPEVVETVEEEAPEVEPVEEPEEKEE
ncbi:MAG: 30S ribosomal protein S1 [Armatimonadota bacterium]